MLNLKAQSTWEAISQLFWSYFQHIGMLEKLIVLPQYYLTGEINLHLLNLLGNIALCCIVVLLSRDIQRYRLPHYGTAVAGLLICNFYAWAAITWPGCPLFYFGTVTLAYACFHWLDLPKPKPVAALIALWISVFTMANGIIALPIAALLVGYRQITEKKYSRAALLIFVAGNIAGLALYIALFNLFDSQVYGAKTLEQSFVNVGGRMIDFLESVGSVPFFPYEYRNGKIALGSLILCILIPLLLSPKARTAPAITGLLLFNLGTIFATSLFRYSAGGNNAYQVFPSIILACLFVLGSQYFTSKRLVPALMLVMAVVFNLNALLHNLPLMQKHNREKAASLQLFLWSGYDINNEWFGIVQYKAMALGIYKPLQHHRLLPIAQAVNELPDCPATSTDSAGTVTSMTAPDAFAIALDYPQASSAIILCGEKNYRLETGPASSLDSKHRVRLLLDKRTIEPGTYRLMLENDDGITAFDNTLQVESVQPYANSSRIRDCNGLAAYTRFPSIKPIHDYFCPD
jgi:hypothetical protein